MKTRVLALAATFLAGAFLTLGASAATLSSSSPGVVAPIRAVVLVDLSGSLSPDDLKREQEAAQALGLAEFSPRSEFLVAGFASWGKDHTPIEQACGRDFIAL